MAAAASRRRLAARRDVAPRGHRLAGGHGRGPAGPRPTLAPGAGGPAADGYLGPGVLLRSAQPGLGRAAGRRGRRHRRRRVAAAGRSPGGPASGRAQSQRRGRDDRRHRGPRHSLLAAAGLGRIAGGGAPGAAGRQDRPRQPGKPATRTATRRRQKRRQRHAVRPAVRRQRRPAGEAIATDYLPMRWMPGLEQRYVPCPIESAASFRATYERPERRLRTAQPKPHVAGGLAVPCRCRRPRQQSAAGRDAPTIVSIRRGPTADGRCGIDPRLQPGRPPVGPRRGVAPG